MRSVERIRNPTSQGQEQLIHITHYRVGLQPTCSRKPSFVGLCCCDRKKQSSTFIWKTHDLLSAYTVYKIVLACGELFKVVRYKCLVHLTGCV